MKRNLRNIFFFFIILSIFSVFVASCSAKKEIKDGAKKSDSTNSSLAEKEFVLELRELTDSYIPKKSSYNFYFTYKLVHSWWDAVALGMESAVRQYEENGIYITFDYLAPDNVSAKDQVNRINRAAASGEYDVIGVDVADIDIVTPAINRLIESGNKVMTFSSSDSGKENGCKRIAYVGNTHNFEDGADLAQILCEKLSYTGQVAMLVGSVGAPCHEERAKGAKSVFSKYPGIELVDVKYDDDSEENAYNFTKEFLSKYPNLEGIICCNMSNPVGAGRAVLEEDKKKKITIVGMDHDKRAIEYLRDGVIYALALQDCFGIGFDTITTAIKIADGVQPGTIYPEKTEEKTTIFYKRDAEFLLNSLYGVIDYK